jgi:hypothetical protein
LRGIDLLGDVGSLIFIISIAFVFFVAIYLIFLILIVFVTNGDVTGN